MTTTLADAWELSRADRGLAVVSTLRADSTIQASLVNTGIVGGTLAFVTYGRVKLANLGRNPHLAVTFRSGWQWATVEGTATLIGPGDADPERLRLLLREIFQAAGGTHDNWDEYDKTMRDQGRTAVLVDPTRIYSN